MQQCKVKDCNSKVEALGYCKKHYQRFKRHGDTETHYRKSGHDLYQTRQYMIWANMIQRCTNPNHKNFSTYGKLGVCKKWLTFSGFWEDMKEGYSDDLTIDRIDNSKGYSKDNCRWATRAEQNRNTKRTIFITAKGETMCLKDWSTKTGIPVETIRTRLKAGWDKIRAVTPTPEPY